MEVLISRMSIGEKSECLFMAYVCVCLCVLSMLSMLCVNVLNMSVYVGSVSDII